MGLYTTLFRKRHCDRCGGDYLCDFQFKTGHDICDEFKDGALVPEHFVKNLTYEATFTPICGFCYSFISRFIEEMRRSVKQILLRSGCELRETSQKTFIWKRDTSIGSYLCTGWLESEKPGKVFRKIENETVEHWRRQIKAANLEPWTRIIQEWGYNFAPVVGRKKEYKVAVFDKVHSKAASVHVGKRFRLELIDIGDKDARRHFLDRDLGIKEPEKK